MGGGHVTAPWKEDGTPQPPSTVQAISLTIFFFSVVHSEPNRTRNIAKQARHYFLATAASTSYKTEFGECQKLAICFVLALSDSITKKGPRHKRGKWCWRVHFRLTQRISSSWKKAWVCCSWRKTRSNSLCISHKLCYACKNIKFVTVKFVR